MKILLVILNTLLIIKMSALFLKLINSFTINNAEVNEILSKFGVGDNVLIPDFYSLSEKFVLPVSDSKELSFIPKSDCRDFDFSKCVWKLDDIVLEIAGSDCKFIKDGSSVTVGSYNSKNYSIVLNMGAV